ncbi:unnamed protein product [Meloidogyne enterolobii]|uniref:Uncharacterized protein n=1 Tax=Meloidogyne enterolobii TaxID=390850 RepID=A0ACB0ZXG2_MELEN
MSKGCSFDELYRGVSLDGGVILKCGVYFRVNTVFIYYRGIHKINLYNECKKLLQNTYNAKRNIYLFWNFFSLARMLIRQFIQNSNPDYVNLLKEFKNKNLYFLDDYDSLEVKANFWMNEFSQMLNVEQIVNEHGLGFTGKFFYILGQGFTSKIFYLMLGGNCPTNILTIFKATRTFFSSPDIYPRYQINIPR